MSNGVCGLTFNTVSIYSNKMGCVPIYSKWRENHEMEKTIMRGNKKLYKILFQIVIII